MNAPVSFCLVSSDHGPIIVNRFDYSDGGAEFYGVGSQILTNGGYEIEEVEFLKSLLDLSRESKGDGVVAIDCGANIGVHSLEWSKHMRGWGSVVAIEAQERVFYALAGNLALQNCFNARAIWAAVDRKCGEMLIPEIDHSQPSSFGSFELKPREKTEYIGQCVDYEELNLKIRTVSIDSLELPRVDLIKMDIEGMEEDGLAGAIDTIRRCRPAIYLETIKADMGAINAMLRDLGYVVSHKTTMNILANWKEC